MIYVIGDSHSLLLADQTGFEVWYERLIPTPSQVPTAHNLIKERTTSGFRERLLDILTWLEPSKLLFSFGESDCRIHIYYQSIKTGKPYMDLINATVQNYIEFIQEIRSLGHDVQVLGIPPCGRQKNRFGVKHYPLPSQQRDIYKLFNDRMRELEEEYIDIYSLTVDEEGFILKDYAKDDTHLNDKALPLILEGIRK